MHNLRNTVSSTQMRDLSNNKIAGIAVKTPYLVYHTCNQIKWEIYILLYTQNDINLSSS